MPVTLFVRQISLLPSAANATCLRTVREGEWSWNVDGELFSGETSGRVRTNIRYQPQAPATSTSHVGRLSGHSNTENTAKGTILPSIIDSATS